MNEAIIRDIERTLDNPSPTKIMKNDVDVEYIKKCVIKRLQARKPMFHDSWNDGYTQALLDVHDLVTGQMIWWDVDVQEDEENEG